MIKKIIGIAGASILFLLLGIGNADAQTLYGANGGGGNPATILFTINPATGTPTPIGPIGFAVTGLAFHPTTGILYGSTGGTAPISPNSIITINTLTGAGTLVGPTGLGGPVADITFRADGTLFGWSEGSDDLVTIDTATGVGTVVSDSGLGTSGSGIAFSPGGVLFFTGEGGDNGLLRILDPVTGLPGATTALTGGPGGQLNALAFNAGGTLFGADNFAGGTLVTIDTATGVVTAIGPVMAALDAIAFGPAAAPPVADTRNTPTLSEWSMFLLAMLIVFGAFLHRRKQARR
jgi:WD40 repeat protein